MTFILGAKCVDGIVMVGDTKVTIDGGADYAYAKKITSPFSTVVVGAAGASGLFSSFHSRMLTAVSEFLEMQKVAEQRKEQPQRLTTERIKNIVENVIRAMHRTYGEDRHLIISNLDVLMAIRIHPIPELVNFLGYGIPEPVNEIKVIGHGQPYGALFIKKLWKPTMTMEQTAKLALFVIKLIGDRETPLDASVGYRYPDYLPQVYFLPNVIIDPKLEGVREDLQAEQERRIAVERCHSNCPVTLLSPEMVNRYMDEVGSFMSDLTDMFSEWQLKFSKI